MVMDVVDRRRHGCSAQGPRGGHGPPSRSRLLRRVRPPRWMSVPGSRGDRPPAERPRTRGPHRPWTVRKAWRGLKMARDRHGDRPCRPPEPEFARPFRWRHDPRVRRDRTAPPFRTSSRHLGHGPGGCTWVCPAHAAAGRQRRRHEPCVPPRLPAHADVRHPRRQPACARAPGSGQRPPRSCSRSSGRRRTLRRGARR